MSNNTLAQDYLEQAFVLGEQDQQEEAVSLYLKAISAAPEWATPHYNLGLHYKYEGNWQLSYQHNKRAVELDTESEAAWWNLGIAATALEDWHTARTAWTKFGLKLEINDEEPSMDLRNIPVRLNLDDAGEVVWCKRIDPARAIILNVPLATSGHRFGDMILNDGAPVGTRISNGVEYSVLNELMLLKSSKHKTYSVTIYTSTQSDIDKLEELCEVAEVEMEDWSTIRYLCKQCSEGVAHQDHDQDIEERETPSERYIGFATINELNLMQVLTDWSVITLCEYSEVVLELE
jgi:tetratricopeptide (TPR) repeat protein